MATVSKEIGSCERQHEAATTELRQLLDVSFFYRMHTVMNILEMYNLDVIYSVYSPRTCMLQESLFSLGGFTTSSLTAERSRDICCLLSCLLGSLLAFAFSGDRHLLLLFGFACLHVTVNHSLKCLDEKFGSLYKLRV